MINKKQLFNVIKVTLLLFSLIAVLWFIFKNANEILKYDYSFSLHILLIASVVSILGHLVNFFVWYKLSYGLGIKTSILEASKAWFLSKMGRYIPGKLPFLLFRLSVYSSFPKKIVTLATGIEYISSIAAASIIVLTGILVTPNFLPHTIKIIALCCSVLIPIFLWPRLLMPCYNSILKLFKKEPLNEFPSYRLIVKAVFGHIVAGFIHGFAFFLLLYSLQKVSIAYYPIITGIIPEPVAIIGVIGIRILVTTTELILTGLFVLLFRFKKKYSE